MRAKEKSTRRDFIKKSSAITAGTIVFPAIVPSSVLGKNPPSNQINIGMVGTGRQAINENLKNGFLKLQNCRIVAVNDVDSWRMDLAWTTVNDAYSNSGKNYKGMGKNRKSKGRTKN